MRSLPTSHRPLLPPDQLGHVAPLDHVFPPPFAAVGTTLARGRTNVSRGLVQTCSHFEFLFFLPTKHSLLIKFFSHL